MEKKTFNDFLNDKDLKTDERIKKLVMPRTREQAEEVMDTIIQMAKDHGADLSDTDIKGIRNGLIRKVEIENDPRFLQEIFHAASAMHAALFKASKEMGDVTAGNFAHILTMTLTAMEEKGIITIHTEKLK